MSEPAPEIAYLEKLMLLQAEAKLAIDGMSAVVAHLDEDLRAQVGRVEANLATVMQVIEEARPLLESGPAKWMARRRMLPQTGAPSGPPA